MCTDLKPGGNWGVGAYTCNTYDTPGKEYCQHTEIATACCFCDGGQNPEDALAPSNFPTTLLITNSPSNSLSTNPSFRPTNNLSSKPSTSNSMMFIKKIKEANKEDKKSNKKFVPQIKISITDEDLSPLQGVDIVLAWNTVNTNGKTLAGTVTRTTKGSGVSRIKFPSIKKFISMTVSVVSISQNGYQYDESMNKKYDGCKAFSSKCPSIVLSFAD